MVVIQKMIVGGCCSDRNLVMGTYWDVVDPGLHDAANSSGTRHAITMTAWQREALAKPLKLDSRRHRLFSGKISWL